MSMTAKEFKQAMQTGYVKKEWHGRKDSGYNFFVGGRTYPLSYVDQRGTMHLMTDVSDPLTRLEERIKPIIAADVFPDRAALLDAVRQKMGFGDPRSDDRAGRMLDAAMQQFDGERFAVDRIAAGQWHSDWRDLPQERTSPEEKRAAVLEWTEEMAKYRQGAKFVLDSRDRRELLELIADKLGLRGEAAQHMLDAEAVRKARGWPASMLKSGDLRGKIEASLQRDSPEAIREQKEAAREAVMEAADEEIAAIRKQTGENAELARLRYQKISDYKTQHLLIEVESMKRGMSQESIRGYMSKHGMKRTQKSGPVTYQELLESGRQAAGDMAAQYKKMGAEILASVDSRVQEKIAGAEALKKERLEAIEQTTSERLQNASRKEPMPSAAAERKANAGALANCFPGGMGKAAQEAVQAQNAQNAQEEGRGMGRRS